MQRWTTLSVCRHLTEFDLFSVVEISSDLLQALGSLPMMTLASFTDCFTVLEWSKENLQAIVEARVQNSAEVKNWLELFIYPLRDFEAVYNKTKDILETVAVRWWIHQPAHDYLKCYKLAVPISNV